MPFNGSGIYQRVRNWVADAAAGIKIRADYHDAEDDGFAQGLTNCITRDGQSTITQNIPFNSKRITGLADPVNPQDAVTKASLTTAVGGYLPLAGGTMTGDIVLARDPDLPLEPSTKQYTDARDAATLAAAKAAGDAAYQARNPQLFAGIPIVTVGTDYTTVGTDAQKMIANWAGRPISIWINGPLYPDGTCISIFAYSGYVAFNNNETMMWCNRDGNATSGNRTLAQFGVATAVKWTGGNWVVSGNGLT
jgi:hypothetical protein